MRDQVHTVCIVDHPPLGRYIDIMPQPRSRNIARTPTPGRITTRSAPRSNRTSPLPPRAFDNRALARTNPAPRIALPSRHPSDKVPIILPPVKDNNARQSPQSTQMSSAQEALSMNGLRLPCSSITRSFLRISNAVGGYVRFHSRSRQR